MALIKRPLIITILEDSASLNEKMYFYESDRNIDFEFTIVDHKFKFNEYSGNMLVESTVKYAIIKVLKPNGQKFMTNIINVIDDKIVLPITADFADECTEVGMYKMQISLLDVDNVGKITIPPVQFEVLAPIFHDNKTDCSGGKSSGIATVSCKRVEE